MTNRQSEGSVGSRPIEPEWEIKTVVTISQDLTPSEEEELLSFLDKNSDVFTWRTSDQTRVSRDIKEHKLEVNPSARPKRQRLTRCQTKRLQ
jgi:hypothetical protein